MNRNMTDTWGLPMGYARVSSDFYIRWYVQPELRTPAREAAAKDRAAVYNGLDEEHLAWCLESMRHHGFDRAVFYDRGDFVTQADWLEFATAPERMFFCIFENTGRQVVAFWMDTPTTTLRQSFIHFTLLVDPQSVEYVAAIRQTAAWVFEHMRIRQLIGLTPACFRHALGLVRAAGFTELARLEKALFVRGRERDAVLSILRKGEV